jgi:8-oxo-dGTP pyrophosphatase MutT (NUDIX family)
MPDEVARLTAALARSGGASSDFDLNPELAPAERILRPAAVLVGIVAGKAGAEVILTKRASHLKHHPGQIAFPGGKTEEGDSGPEATALREAEEEIGLPPSLVRPIGRLPGHETVTGFQMTPILAEVANFSPLRDPAEVEEVFTVPLAHLLNPARYRVERREWRGQWRSYYAVPWGPYYIWGATARILRGLAERAAG